MSKRRSFLATIADLRAGRTQDELTEELGRLVQAVADTGKAGELTIKLKIKPAAKDSHLIHIADEIIVKAPKMDRASTLMFASEGSLTLDDPHSKVDKNNLKSVGGEERGELKAVTS